MLVFGDGFNGWKGVVHDGGWVLGRGPDAREFMDSTARSQRRHRGRANVLFCDGHTDSLALKFLFEDESDEALRIWNRDNLPHRERLNP
jgi:prepilin-type processing-associated H-X9-DG protein